MYPENIMRSVRQYIGLEKTDTSRDEEIYAMSRKEVLDAVCEWDGLIGYSPVIIGWIEDIYRISLEG